MEERLIAYEDQLGAKDEPRGRVYSAWDEPVKEGSKSKRAKLEAFFKHGKPEDPVPADITTKDVEALIASRVQSVKDKEKHAENKRAEKEQRDKDNTCFNCGKTGHWSYQCPEPRRNGDDWNDGTWDEWEEQETGGDDKKKESVNWAILQAPY